MRVRLKGLASATKKLADGTVKTYHYAWRGGPQLPGQCGSPEFMAAYHEAVAQRRAPSSGVFKAIIADYRSSSAYERLSASSKRAYASYIRVIEDEFGDVPIGALADIRMRGEFLEWRDKFASTPRKADYAWTTLSRILSWAKDRGKIAGNVCERGGRLYVSDRVDKVWTEADLEKLFQSAPAHVSDVALLALWTGQREGDLLKLTWQAYDGRYITLRQGKSRRLGKLGRVVTIPVSKPLRAMLERLKRSKPSATTILCNSYGKPWTEHGFRSSWDKVTRGLSFSDADLHFHDLRGTAVTRLALASCTVPEIATITGHSLATVQTILDKYLSRDVRLAEAAILKLEENENRSKIANRLQTEAVCSSCD